MKLKKIPIDLKKLPLNLSLLLLTLGASLILGFLSFGGMYTLLPILPLAFAAFGLSVAYEGEIYLQNIKGALKKLLKSNYLENTLAKEYLLNHFPEHTKDEDCPQFFRDYKAQLKLLRAFGHKELNKESKKRKKQVEKTLADMEKWFALQLFSSKEGLTEDQSDYAKKLRLWLAQNNQDEFQERLKKRRFQYNIVKAFSVLAGLFMGLGSTYLIVEAFTVIPFFAAIPFTFWPIIILPMAIVAGAAYGMLTFNAVTDMINNNTVIKWYNKIRQDLSQGLTLRNVFIASTAVFLVGLALALTICTAGTWWTVATNARPLFEWMKKMPSFIMGVINPIITGLSAIFFNIENTAESLEMIDQATRSDKNVFEEIYTFFAKGYKHLRETENWLQIFNPFRIILKLTVTPLRILLFLGHLLSIALTADRMPGVPQIISMLIAIISEGFEDAHYFIGLNHDHDDDEHDHCNDHEHQDFDTLRQEHLAGVPEIIPTMIAMISGGFDDGHHHCNDHKHQDFKTLLQEHQDFKILLKEHLDENSGHSHDMDIPTWVLKTLASPIYALAALWDFSASKMNQADGTKTKQPSILSFSDAWDKQRGIPKEENVALETKAKRPSKEWQVEHAVAQIEKFETKHLKGVRINKDLADAKIIELNKLKENIRKPKQGESLAETLNQAKNQPIYNQHRLFAQVDEKTMTQEFIETLPHRVNVG